jgi:hypothetical protein
METQQRKRLSQAIRTITRVQAQAERQEARKKVAAGSAGDRRRMLREYARAMQVLEAFFTPDAPGQ